MNLNLAVKMQSVTAWKRLYVAALNGSQPHDRRSPPRETLTNTERSRDERPLATEIQGNRPPEDHRSRDIRELVANAADVVAPVWPLKTFIAVNPLQGLEDLPFEWRCS